MEEGEGHLAGAVADGGAVAGEDDAAGCGGRGGGEGDPDGADGFINGAAVGACDAGGGEGEVCVGDAAGAFGHGAGDWFGNGSVLFDEWCGDLEVFLLGAVGVGDEAALEAGGGAGGVG